jgi:hypothetical protein
MVKKGNKHWMRGWGRFTIGGGKSAFVGGKWRVLMKFQGFIGICRACGNLNGFVGILRILKGFKETIEDCKLLRSSEEPSETP